MTTLTITGADVLDMIRHWLCCPVNGYYGSSYGSDPKSVLMQALNSDRVDDFLAKLQRDVPITQTMQSAIFVGIERTPPDQVRLIIEVSNAGVLAFSPQDGVQRVQ